MRSSCLAVAVAVASASALVLPATAAPKPQITDRVGDATAGMSGGYDVVSALFATTGTTAKVGRRLVYTPTKLVITLTYAGDVPPDPWSVQVVTFDAPGCGEVYLERFNGVAYGRAGCLVDDFEFATRGLGRTLTFTVPFATLGKDRPRKGTVLSKLRTYTALGDPLFGYETGEAAGPFGVVDDATTTVKYPIG